MEGFSRFIFRPPSVAPVCACRGALKLYLDEFIYYVIL